VKPTKETIPRAWTGTVVGIVSFVGFTPDLFGHLLSGYFVDSFEGIIGYRYYFALMAIVALLGMLLSLSVRSMPSEQPKDPKHRPPSNP
jgi:MFS family permease